MMVSFGLMIFFKILNFSGEENSMKINPYQPVNKQTVGQTAGQ